MVQTHGITCCNSTKAGLVKRQLMPPAQPARTFCILHRHYRT